MTTGAAKVRVAVALLLMGIALAAPLAVATQWQDVADAVGVRFRHSGPTDTDVDNRFAEATGSGVCWSDVDQDGYDDLYLVNTPYWNASVQEARRPHARLFVNEGDGTFTDRTAGSGVDFSGWGQGCAFGDYDGDGYPDLFVAAWGDDKLYRNEGDGSFRDVTGEAGVGDAGKCGEALCWGSSAVWFDHDRDGDLDLYVVNYVDWEDGPGPPGPESYPGQRNILWRNEADGTFVDVTDQAGVGDDPSLTRGKGLGVAANDFDLDGWPDLYIANDMAPNTLFRNRGDGTFIDVAADAGVDDPRAGMGVAFQDADGDGWPDLFMTHYQEQHNGLYLNRRDGTFSDHSGEGELADDLPYVGWGTAFADVDNDGDQDIVVVNGHTNSILPEEPPGYRQAKLLFLGDGGGYKNATASAGTFFTALHVGRGSAMADFDWDGDLDIAVNNNGDEAAELGEASGAEGRWVHVLLRQPGLNRHGIGARIVVQLPDGTAQTRVVQAGGSYQSQDSLAAHFGLGKAEGVTSTVVTWPDGLQERFPGIAAGRVVRLTRGGGVEEDTLAPRTTASLAGVAGNGGWWRSPVTATLVAVDRGVSVVSGVAKTEVAVGDGAWEPYQGQALAFGEGVQLLRGRSLDLAGNQEPRRTTAVRVDLTAPSVAPAVEGTPGLKGWWVSPSVDVALPASDALSGAREVRHRLDGGAWRTYEGPFAITADGVHAIAWEAEDVAGNVAAGSFEVKVDHTPPEVRLTNPKNGTLHLGAQQLANLLTGPAFIVATPALGPLGCAVFPAAAQASDAASGMALVDFLLNGSLQASDAMAPYAWAWDTGSWPGGAYVLQAAARDEAGNGNASQVRVVLASATPEGVLATLQRGPSLNLGLGPVAGLPLPALVALCVLGARRRG